MPNWTRKTLIQGNFELGKTITNLDARADKNLEMKP
jgi:hypothetical protein